MGDEVRSAGRLLRALIVEDRAADAELIVRQLRADGFVVEACVVAEEAGYSRALGGEPDVILSDYTLPRFDAPAALRLRDEKGLDIPFIVLTGSISEEVAVDMMKRGADDYLLKDRLARLGAAIEQALEQRLLRRRQAEVQVQLRAKEEQLRQAQKMEAIGRLAGGVAHDFNNLLTVILGYCEVAEERAPEDVESREALGAIRSAAERASALTRQLIAFSRTQVHDPRRIDVNAVVRDVQTLLARLIGEHIRLHVDCAADLPQVIADPNQLAQVVLNLAVHARDAMPRGGKLSITTRTVTRMPLPDGDAAGQAVLLSVADDGLGMEQGVVESIFEPFATVKQPGQGTGLGLAMVYGIVRQTGGSIEVDSAPGQGATFRVYLPVAQGASSAGGAAAPRRAEVAARSQRILVVEDDVAVRSVLERLLLRRGCEVVTAPTRAEALERAAPPAGAGAPRPFDAALVDVVLAGESGIELAAELRARCPELALILMSGYTRESARADELRARGMTFLPKPFTATELDQAIRTAAGLRAAARSD